MENALRTIGLEFYDNDLLVEGTNGAYEAVPMRQVDNGADLGLVDMRLIGPANELYEIEMTVWFPMSVDSAALIGILFTLFGDDSLVDWMADNADRIMSGRSVTATRGDARVEVEYLDALSWLDITIQPSY